MAITGKMLASQILICGVKSGVKSIPIVGEFAVELVGGLQKRHEDVSNTARMAGIEAQLSRIEKAMRDSVEAEVRNILTNLGRPGLTGPELTKEMREFLQIREQGWSPNLFEGLLRNSSHWRELKSNPQHYGRILRDEETVDPDRGVHILLDMDKTRILEIPPSSLAYLLANQSLGVPEAEVRSTMDVWAFPSEGSSNHENRDALPDNSSFKATVFVPIPDAPKIFKPGVDPLVPHAIETKKGKSRAAYYVGVETSGVARRGVKPPVKLLCVLAMGVLEETEMDVPGSEFGLVIGEPALFRFFTSARRMDDRPGAVLDRWSSDEIEELSPLEIAIGEDSDNSETVSVRLRSKLTEEGNLQLWCRCTTDNRRWKLEYQNS